MRDNFSTIFWPFLYNFSTILMPWPFLAHFSSNSRQFLDHFLIITRNSRETNFEYFSIIFQPVCRPLLDHLLFDHFSTSNFSIIFQQFFNNFLTINFAIISRPFLDHFWTIYRQFIFRPFLFLLCFVNFLTIYFSTISRPYFYYIDHFTIILFYFTIIWCWEIKNISRLHKVFSDESDPHVGIIERVRIVFTKPVW